MLCTRNYRFGMYSLITMAYPISWRRRLIHVGQVSTCPWRLFLSILFVGYGWQLPAFSQVPMHENGLLLQSSDLRTGRVLYGFSNGQPGYTLKTRFLPISKERWQLKTPDTTLLIDPSTAWGFRLAGKTYRFGRTGSYELTHVGGICLYRYYTSRSVYDYFSRDLDSPILPLTPRRMKRVYADNPSMLQALNRRKWYQNTADILRMSDSLHVNHFPGHASIDHKVLTSDKTVFGRNQEQNHAGNVVGLPHPTGRMLDVVFGR